MSNPEEIENTEGTSEKKVLENSDESLLIPSENTIVPNTGLNPAAYSILYWVLSNGVKNEKGEELDFTDRLFLLDILTDWSPGIVWKKCSQVGGSVTFTLKALYAVMYKGLNVILTYPSDSDAEEFVKTKTNPLIKENGHLFPRTSADSVYLKQLNGRNLYVKGTVSKTAAISTTADLLIHDEASRSDQKNMAFYQSRIKASPYRGTWMFSNPTTERDTLDEWWQRSDQKEWFITCPSCKEEQMLSWPESIDKERECFQCKVCKEPLSKETRRKGKWKKTRESELSGYHTSHLMAPWIEAKEIIRDSQGDQEYFYNFVLGEPYNPGDLSVTRSLILDNWTPEDLSKDHNGSKREWFLGVDVGNMKHYVLGTDLGVVKVGRFTDWSFLDELMKQYDPYLVIDAMPDNTASRHFVDTYQRAYMSFFQDNHANPQTIVWWGKPGEPDTQSNKGKIVYSNRNRILDQLIDDLLKAKIRFGVKNDAEFRIFIDQWLTLRRMKVTDARGIEKYVWESTTGNDHGVFALLYSQLARMTKGEGKVLDFPDEPLLIDRDNIVKDFSILFDNE